jgi:predicted transposase/invertase (TIGR01784 family)
MDVLNLRPFFVRRDAIFYTIFKRSPNLLFELVNDRPDNPAGYRFESVEIKEPNFRIDGVFLPSENDPSRTVFFAEIQFQRDESLYHRFFSESLLYLHRNQTLYDDWYGVVIFRSRNLEPTNTKIHRSLLEGAQVQRIYLDEMSNSEDQPIGVRLMQLTIASDVQMIEQGKQLIEQATEDQAENLSRQDIIEVVTAIAVYKFTNIDRAGVEAMLGINLEETRIYQEARAEGELIGEQRGELRGKLVAIPLLVKSGISPEKIAEQLELDLDVVQQAIQSQAQE